MDSLVSMPTFMLPLLFLFVPPRELVKVLAIVGGTALLEVELTAVPDNLIFCLLMAPSGVSFKWLNCLLLELMSKVEDLVELVMAVVAVLKKLVLGHLAPIVNPVCTSEAPAFKVKKLLMVVLMWAFSSCCWLICFTFNFMLLMPTPLVAEFTVTTLLRLFSRDL